MCFELFSLTVFVSQNGTIPLHKAAQEGHLPVVEFLIERAPQMIEAKTNEVSAARCVLSLFRPDTVCDSVGASITPSRCFQ